MTDAFEKFTELARGLDSSLVDWDARPDRVVTVDHDFVTVRLEGMRVRHVSFDEYWFAEASQEAVERAVAKAVTAALSDMMEAEIADAMATPYQDADTQSKLVQLSAEFSEFFTEQLKKAREQ